MKLTLDSARQAGAFDGPPIKKELIVNRGSDHEPLVFDVWVREMSYQTMVDSQAAGKTADIVAARIAACICHEDGSPVFTIADITGIGPDGMPVMKKDDHGKKVEQGPLSRQMVDALVDLVMDVSGMKPKKKEVTPPTTQKAKSGTN